MNAPEPERDHKECQQLERDDVRAEAEIRAHERLTPDYMLEPIAAVNLYVEAFLAGARYAAQRRATR